MINICYESILSIIDMFKMIRQRISNFLKSNLSWKLRKISKYSHINFYPNFFSRSGLGGLYSRLIIHFILNEKFKKIKDNIIKDFYNYKNDQLNFLISTPSSGSNFTRNMLRSYFELFYQLGDGVPKYDSVNASLFFAGSQIDSADLNNQLTIEKHLIDKKIIMSEADYNKKKIVFSRYPLERIDLYKFEQVKPVILFRDPFDEIGSVYHKYDRRPEEKRLKEIDYKLLTSKIKLYEKYINFWSQFTSNPLNKNKFLAINFEDLVKNSEKILEKILIFYEYPINQEFIKKSAFTHSSENTIKKLMSSNFYKKKQRFSDPEIKKNQQKLIKETFNKMILKTNIIKDYDYLKSLT